jgi:hypothetical protein
LRALIRGELTISPNALPLVMDILDKPSDPHTEGFMRLPTFEDSVTVQIDGLHDANDTLEAVYRLAEDHPETTGELTVFSRCSAQSYRISSGKLHRRSLSDAPEHELSLYTPRKGPIRAMLVTQRELEGIKLLQRTERRSRETRQRRA